MSDNTPADPPRTVRAAAVHDIDDEGVVVLDRADTGHRHDIAVFRSGENFYALDDMCTHQEALLSRGWVEDDEVVCPLHTARFRLRDGLVTCFPASWPVRTHRVEIRDDQVWVRVGEPAEGAPDLD